MKKSINNNNYNKYFLIHNNCHYEIRFSLKTFQMSRLRFRLELESSAHIVFFSNYSNRTFRLLFHISRYSYFSRRFFPRPIIFFDVLLRGEARIFHLVAKRKEKFESPFVSFVMRRSGERRV